MLCTRRRHSHKKAQRCSQREAPLAATREKPTPAPRISKIAGKYAVSDLPFEDIVAEGNLGLTEALMAGVTEEKEIRASIENQIERFIAEMRSERDADDRLTAQVVLLSETIDRWNSEHGEKPTVDELANELGVSQDKILDILKLTGEVPEDEK